MQRTFSISSDYPPIASIHRRPVESLLFLRRIAGLFLLVTTKRYFGGFVNRLDHEGIITSHYSSDGQHELRRERRRIDSKFLPAIMSTHEGDLW